MKGKIRIISGQWRGRKLVVPDRPGLRPTGDRVRETLFNWLQAPIVGAHCLDLFAGTGALGLEALSRAAASAVLVERDRRLVEALRAVSSQWPGGERMEVVQADALRWLAGNTRSFDLVFIDPPFAEGLQHRVLEALADGGHLSADALIYVEQAARDAKFGTGDRFDLLREKIVGEVRLTLLAPR